VRYERKDAHYRKAKAHGLRARSAFKLAELDDRFRLLARGDRVVDVGAWPGGWMQVALERIGPAGRLVGVDVVPIDPLGATNLALVIGDIEDPTVLRAVVASLGGPADVVLSDAAPKLTGVRDVDAARCGSVVAAVLDALPGLLRPGGRLLIKVFMDPSYPSTVARVRASFADVKTTRPDASRRGSSELYVAAVGFRGSG